MIEIYKKEAFYTLSLAQLLGVFCFLSCLWPLTYICWKKESTLLDVNIGLNSLVGKKSHTSLSRGLDSVRFSTADTTPTSSFPISMSYLMPKIVCVLPLLDIAVSDK